MAAKGPAVSLPLGSQAPVQGIGLIDNVTHNSPATNVDVRDASLGETTYPYSLGATLTIPTTNWWFRVDSGSTTTSNPLIFADLSDATAATINQLREAFQIQKLYERDARGGTRYTEILRSHFGVISPDARLQRPEYLGGGSSPVNVSVVAQTAPQQADGVTTPQGNLAAFATAQVHGHGFTKSFTEHCLIIGLVSVRADLNYQQGLDRMWSRQIRWDYYWPSLAHIGEQAVLNKEIYAQGDVAPAVDDQVFGYQERYAELRYKPSLITGQFRSNFAQSLDAWHLAQDFGSLPLLDDEFIAENPPVDRIKAVSSSVPDFIFDSYFDYHHVRPLPMYGTPGFTDRF